MQEVSLRNLPKLDEEQRNNSLYSLACSLQARGASDSEIEKFIREENNYFAKPVLESEIKTIIKSALKNEKGIPYLVTSVLKLSKISYNSNERR